LTTHLALDLTPALQPDFYEYFHVLAPVMVRYFGLPLTIALHVSCSSLFGPMRVCIPIVTCRVCCCCCCCCCNRCCCCCNRCCCNRCCNRCCFWHEQDTDPTVYAVSAWNDNGFHRIAHGPYSLRRTSFFPGLGWLLSRELFVNTLQSAWPANHWDFWLRSIDAVKDKAVVFPEVSEATMRTAVLPNQ
jgi:hypothetical protein